MPRHGVVPALLALLAAGACLAQEPRSRLEEGTVTGRVTTIDGEPLAFVNVVVLNTNLGATTDSDGRFTIRAVPSGSHRIRFSCLGHDPIEERIEVRERSALRMEVRLRENPAMIRMGTAGTWRLADPEAAARHEAAAREAQGVPFEIVDGTLDFALDLARAIDASGENLCVSPFSVSSALAMTYAGARGATATEIARALRFHVPPDDLHAGFGKLLRMLRAAGRMGVLDLGVANRLWIDDAVDFLEPYAALMQERYEAAPERVPFAADPAGARERINAWVARETSARISSLLPEGSVDSSTVCVLTAALYLNAPWKHPFDPGSTSAAVFRLSLGDSILVPMMERTGSLRFADPEGLKLVELPFLGDVLSMILLLPDAGAGLPAFERSLNADRLRAWLRLLEPRTVRVSLPRFGFRFSRPLRTPLESLGMTTTFTPEADFAGIASTRSLFLNNVLHETWIQVDENGTEAAAATGATLTKGMSKDPALFLADRPFLFLVRDQATGVILFLGRVVNPLR